MIFVSFIYFYLFLFNIAILYFKAYLSKLLSSLH